MKIIGVIGQNGTGKDEVLRYLRSKYGVPFLSTGEMVRKIATKEKKEPTRENLGEISDRYFKKLGRGCFVRMAADRIRENKWQTAGISGIRSLDDVLLLKNLLDKDFVLIRVFVSDPHLRYTRMNKRGEGRDPHSYEQLLKQDKAEEELFHVGEAEKQADYSLSNDGTLEDLHREIEKLVVRNNLLRK